MASRITHHDSRFVITVFRPISLLLVFFGFTVLLFSSGFVSAFAEEGYFENDFSRELDSEPIVCIFQPNDPRIDDSRWNRWYSEMKTAIDTWESELKQSFISGYWEITVVEVPLDKLDRLNRSACDITVEFTDDPLPPPHNYALGWYYAGNIELFYIQSEYCGKQFLPEYHITVDTVCHKGTIERSKRMASVLQHEFGHALGMSHYVSDNPHLTQQWYDNFGIGAPSIMTRQPANEEMKKITSIDIDLIRKIYSSNGFGKKSAFVPVFYEPEPKPDSIHDEFSSKKSKIIITPRNTKMFTISGNVPEDIYRRGIPAEIQIIYPDSTKETHGIPVSKHQHYEYPLKFNYDSQSGNYKVLVQFNHKLIQELTLNVKKESTSKIYNGDVDGDGFPDEKDACPDEYGSHKYSEGCPTFPPRPDKDSDGIPDKWDDCPTASGLEDRNGCPVHIPKPDKDGDGIPDGKDSCPTIAGIIQNSLRLNGCPDTPSSEITKKQSWDSTKQEMWTKVSQQYEILSEVKLKSLEAKEKLELAKLTLENNKKTISKVQSNQDLERFQDTVYNRFENFEKLISEAKELERKSDVLPIKNKAYNEFQTLKNGLQQAENALTQLNPNNKKATEKVNQAWDLLKINKQKLNSLESRLNVADNNLASGNYELAKQFYTFDPDYNRIFGKNLIKISELIEDANNNQSTCFLFWCW